MRKAREQTADSARVPRPCRPFEGSDPVKLCIPRKGGKRREYQGHVFRTESGSEESPFSMKDTTGELFGSEDRQGGKERRPLAERMRPRCLEEMVGQQHLLGPGKVLREAVERGRLFSMLY